MEVWLAGLLRGVDSSLLDEWERLRNPSYRPGEDEETEPEVVDITHNKREFTALIRTEIFRFLKQLAVHNAAGAVAVLASSGLDAASLQASLDEYCVDHERIRMDNEARNGRHTYVEVAENGGSWRVSQVLIDPVDINDWQAVFTVDLARAREDNKVSLTLVSLGPVAS